ncbi:MAG: FMN-binding protein [Phascolarctobacterium sp.]|nr:FMN-binding protein [Phascolarctobacterium sp.]
MKKALSLALALLMVAAMFAGCSQTEEVAGAETFTGTGDGFGGQIVATVTVEDGKITALDVEGASETAGIGDVAITSLVEAIVAAGTVEGIDVVAGATWTSNGVIYAINNALDSANYPYPVVKEEADAEAIAAAEATFGLGIQSDGRLGPGSDDTGVPVYSFNQVYATAVFDAEGRIMSLRLDQLEVATPNYDGEGMPHFAGWPGQEYNYDENHDEVVDGTLVYDDDAFLEAIAGWQTKRERGDGYKMNSGSWSSEADKFEEIFVGMTVEEVNEWFVKYCSDKNGRPLKEPGEKTSDEDRAKYEALTDEEKAMLADVTASATMSLNDSHGNILAAIEKAYENRKPLSDISATGLGLGVDNMGRIGPGKDDTDVQVYSFNNVVAAVLLDSEGRIAALYLDQLEIATPNYDGEGMPHFAGWPGFEYNYDENHDAVVDGTLGYDDDSFLAAINGWQSKRERGDGYKMNSGTWSSEADKFEEIFVGMTLEEVLEWFEKYCSDLNGRPLKEPGEKTKDEDRAKFEALSDDEKAMLVDLTATATMSLNDGHGNILGAIKAAVEACKNVDITVG